jgi:hypothetical protein
VRKKSEMKILLLIPLTMFVSEVKSGFLLKGAANCTIEQCDNCISDTTARSSGL